MGEESAWQAESVSTVVTVALSFVTVALVVLGAPPIFWIISGSLAVLLIFWAFSHAKFIARRLPWWVHAQSRLKRKEEKVLAIREHAEMQARVVAEAIDYQKRMYASVMWRTEHRVGEIWGRVNAVVVSLKPPMGFEITRSIGQTARCRMDHDGTTYEAIGICDKFGVDVEFRDFKPAIGTPPSMGRYQVEWSPSFPATVERDVLFIGTKGRILRT
jgi:hypothetical protein